MKKLALVLASIFFICLVSTSIPVNAQPAIGKLYSERWHNGAVKKNGHRLWRVKSNSSSAVKGGLKNAKARSNSTSAVKGASAPTMSLQLKGRSNSSVKGSTGYNGTISHSRSPIKN